MAHIPTVVNAVLLTQNLESPSEQQCKPMWLVLTLVLATWPCACGHPTAHLLHVYDALNLISRQPDVSACCRFPRARLQPHVVCGDGHSVQQTCCSCMACPGSMPVPHHIATSSRMLVQPELILHSLALPHLMWTIEHHTAGILQLLIPPKVASQDAAIDYCHSLCCRTV